MYMSKKTISEKQKKYQKQWVSANRDKVKVVQKRYRDKNREKCIARTVRSNRITRAKYREMTIKHYGGENPSCACCGENTRIFLTLDHINGGGRQHRKEMNNKAGGVHGWIVKSGFPNGFQVLCMNCNWGKYINNGQCPHKNND